MRLRSLAVAGLFAAGAITGLTSSEIIHAQVSAYSNRQLLKADLQNIPGQEVLVFTSDWPPGRPHSPIRRSRRPRGRGTRRRGTKSNRRRARRPDDSQERGSWQSSVRRQRGGPRDCAALRVAVSRKINLQAYAAAAPPAAFCDNRAGSRRRVQSTASVRPLPFLLRRKSP